MEQSTISCGQWEKHDFKPRPEDIIQERLYCVQWMHPKKKGKGFEYEFRSVTRNDLKRESIVEDYVSNHLIELASQGLASGYAD